METTQKTIELPDWIPVLPVRNTVLFPNAAVPLMVGRDKSVEAVKRAQLHGEVVLVVSQRNSSIDEPSASDLYEVGVVCLLSKVLPLEKEGFQLIVNGLVRFKVAEYSEKDGYLAARGAQQPEISSTLSTRAEAVAEQIKKLGKEILKIAAVPGADGIQKILTQIKNPSQVADLCATFLNLPVSEKQELLELTDLELRLDRLMDLTVKEKRRLEVQNEIQNKMAERLSKDQREHILREQMRTISEELTDEPGGQDEYRKKIDAAGMPPEVKKVADEELVRLGQIQRASPEYQVVRTYLDWLVALPWSKTSGTDNDKIKLDEAKKTLDADHYGLDKVKDRILQFLAVTKLKKDMKGPILCLAGPPGVGKTSIAKSIAKALNRNFVRMSLGGVRDEAEIRGHRRTYIGALPGRFVQSLKRAGVKDPLILLDEVDKIGMDFRGDPASALLEVLDPEQNHTFTDHYLDLPFDLSRVFFVTTANMVDNIPPALRDRLEVIEMSSYTKAEKLEIAKNYLVPKALEDHGIRKEQLGIPDSTLTELIDGYTREAGVRQLTREIAHLCRASAENFAKENPESFVEVGPEKLETILGTKKYHTETALDLAKPGVVTGLAWTPVGGEILHIEVARMEGKGNLILTGQLGDVMKESAQIALSLLRSQLGGAAMGFDKSDFHIHVPAGAIPKDGPSAGTAIFLALASLIQEKSVSPKLALTGEITLRGSVLPVGGIKEKVIAAHRAGVTTVILPDRNKGDLKDIPGEVKNALSFHFVKDVKEVLELAGLNPLPVPESLPHLPTYPPLHPGQPHC